LLDIYIRISKEDTAALIILVGYVKALRIIRPKTSSLFVKKNLILKKEVTYIT